MRNRSPASPAARAWTAVALVALVLLAPAAPALPLALPAPRADDAPAPSEGDGEAGGDAPTPAPEPPEAPQPAPPETAEATCIIVSQCHLWATRVNFFGQADERATHLVPSPDGTRLYAGGFVSGTPSAKDFLVLAFDVATAAVVWERRWAGPLGVDDELLDLELSPDGSSLYAVGVTRGNAVSLRDFVVLALDPATGDIVWTDRYSQSSGWDAAHRAVVSPDGTRLYVTGTSQLSGASFEFVTIAYDAATGAREWFARRTVGFSSPSGIALSPDGSYVYVTGSASGARVLALAYHAGNGTVAWETTYNGGSATDAVSASAGLALSPDGSRVYVGGSGWSSNANQTDWSLLALDAADGRPLWHRTYNGPSSYSDSLRRVAVSPDGTRVFAAGTASVLSVTRTDAVVRAYDAATGELLWHHQASLNDVDEGADLAVSPDGSRLLVVGRTVYAATKSDFLAFALDASTGTRVWTTTYDGGRNAADAATALVLAPDGSRLYATGESRGAGLREDVLVLALDAATGGREWTARVDHDGSGDEEARAVAGSPDGSRVYVAGRTLGTDRGSDVVVASYATSDGALLWSDVVDGAGGDDVVGGLAVSGDTLVVAAHGAHPGTGDDLLTWAYDGATGERLWTSRYDGPGSGADRAAGVVVVDGRVLVAAESRGTANADAALVTYDLASGAELHVARWDGGTGDDRAAAVAADAGRVFVVGSTMMANGKTDFVTLAFDAATSDLLWSARHDGGASGPDAARAVAAAAGVVAVAGITYVRGSYEDAGTVLYDAATGERRWTAVYNGPDGRRDAANAVGVSDDGATVFMAAESANADDRDDWAIVAYWGTNGTARWAQRFDRWYDDRPRGLAVLPGGHRVVVVGEATASVTEAVLAAYDTETGTRAFWAKYDPFVLGWGHRAAAVALAPDGRTAYVGATVARHGTYHDLAAVAWRVVEPPGEPRSVAATRGPGRGEISLSWGTPSTHGGLPVESYRVYRSDHIYGLYEFVAELGPDARSFTDTGRPDATDVAYNVAASNAEGEGTRAYVVGRTPGPPTRPQTLTATAGPGRGQITLAWSPPLDDGGLALSAYRIYRTRHLSEEPVLVHTLGPGVTQRTDSGLQDGTRYDYYVAAVNEVGEGVRASADARTFQRPTAPLDVQATPGDVRRLGEVTVTWKAPSDEGGTPVTLYHVYRTSGQGGWTSVGSTQGNARSFTDTTALLPETYHYRVTATNIVGESGPSESSCTAPSHAALVVNRLGKCRDMLPV